MSCTVHRVLITVSLALSALMQCEFDKYWQFDV